MKIKNFETSKKCRKISFIFVLLTMIYRAFFEERIGVVILLTIAIYFVFQYKCPHCQKTIDIRQAPHKIEYCPYCGKYLDE